MQTNKTIHFKLLDVTLEIINYKKPSRFRPYCYVLIHEYKDRATSNKKYYMNLSIQILNNKLK